MKASTTSSFKYKPKFGVVVMCQDEKHQRKVYEQLKKEGHKLKVVTV